MKTYQQIKVTNLLLLIVGITILTASVYYAALNELLKLPGVSTIFLLFLAAAAGLILRSLTLGIFYGSRLTLHQSLSFEWIFQTVRAIVPGLPATFEQVFIMREVSLDCRTTSIWSGARRNVSILLGLGAFMTISLLTQSIIMTVVFCVLILGFLILNLKNFVVVESLLKQLLSGLLVYLCEGAIFCYALHPELEIETAILLYLGFNLFYYSSPVPGGLGLAELPALLDRSSIAMPVLLIFHLFRLLPLPVFYLLYFTRYKLNFSDLFRPDLALIIDRTRRPPHGWSWKCDMERPDISVVIPAYNEEQRLPVFLDSILDFLKENKRLKIEVLVVDDGSSDRTIEVVKSYAAKCPKIKLLAQVRNQGKGAAVRSGMLVAEGNYIVYADADGATPISELNKLIPLMEKSYEIVIGSRRMNSASVARKGVRELMGMVFYKTVNFFAVPGVSDTQCGFKAFRRDVAHKLFGNAIEDGWAFDVEILYLAQLYGFAIMEISVNWNEIEGSKVNPIKDALKMLIAVFRIRRHHSGFTKLTN